MRALNEVSLEIGGDSVERSAPSCRDLLRAATRAPHERLHLHPGFSAVQNGSITRLDYQALLTRLLGFYLPFERALGVPATRSRWLARDIAWLGVEAPSPCACASIPRYHGRARKLGALYVVEGAALGGRVLARGLDGMAGPGTVEGRRFFIGRGALSGPAWVGYLSRLASIDPNPAARAAVVSAATETFEVFETWLSHWNETK